MTIYIPRVLNDEAWITKSAQDFAVSEVKQRLPAIVARIKGETPNISEDYLVNMDGEARVEARIDRRSDEDGEPLRTQLENATKELVNQVRNEIMTSELPLPQGLRLYREFKTRDVPYMSDMTEIVLGVLQPEYWPNLLERGWSCKVPEATRQVLKTELAEELEWLRGNHYLP